jgi:hypothetical protein
MLHVPFREKQFVDKDGALTKGWRAFFKDLGASYGTWHTVPHAAGDFTANGSMTWTVESADLSTFAYVEMGKLLIVAVTVTGAVVGGVVNTTLQVTLPAQHVAARNMSIPVWVTDAGTKAIGVARVTAGSAVIAVQKVDGSNWTAGANGIEGQIAIEVE